VFLNFIVWNHGASKKKIFNITFSGLVVKNAKKEKKNFFVLLMINLNKFLLLVGHNYWKKIKKSDYQKQKKVVMEKKQTTVRNQTNCKVNITINSTARRSQALQRLRRYQLLIHVWIGRLSAYIANISNGLTTWRPIIQKLTEESISNNW